MTDREPQLTQIGCDPFDEQHGDWPAADWRLNGVNKTWAHGFPDCAALLDWMASVARDDDALSQVERDARMDTANEAVTQGMLAALQHPEVLRFLRRFKRCAQPLPVRLTHFDSGDKHERSLAV